MQLLNYHCYLHDGEKVPGLLGDEVAQGCLHGQGGEHWLLEVDGGGPRQTEQLVPDGVLLLYTDQLREEAERDSVWNQVPQMSAECGQSLGSHHLLQYLLVPGRLHLVLLQPLEQSKVQNRRVGTSGGCQESWDLKHNCILTVDLDFLKQSFIINQILFLRLLVFHLVGEALIPDNLLATECQELEVIDGEGEESCLKNDKLNMGETMFSCH